MEKKKYIEQLRMIEMRERLEVQTGQKEREKIGSENPLVVCCVTMGKEPHLGHLMLLSIADQTRVALGGKLPVVLINNNTGPRAAGAVVSMADSRGISLPDAVMRMGQGVYPVEEIVARYRQRSEDVARVKEADNLIKEMGVDVFAAVTSKTQKLLSLSGFDVEIVSEVEMQQLVGRRLENLNPVWKGTGFLPFVSGNRVVNLKNSGELTATGALLSTVNGLVARTRADLVVVVDSQPDAIDVAFVATEMEGVQKGVQVFGAGVGFGGIMASGTRGEAMTIGTLVSEFGKFSSVNKLRQAVAFLTWDRPLNMGLKGSLPESFYDFENNKEAVDELIKSADESGKIRPGVVRELELLAMRVGDRTVVGNKKLQEQIKYLQQRSVALAASEAPRVLAESKKVVDGVRQNYYLNTLRGIRKMMGELVTVSEADYLAIGLMIKTCLSRLGL